MAKKESSCLICLDIKPNTQIFQITDCSHRYCFSCMKKHVEVKLLHAILPKCPHENCISDLKIESCKAFLPSKLLEIMIHRLKEASIPVTDRVYCPFPKCSALMSKSEGLEIDDYEEQRGGERLCVMCCKVFCINCKVPWHDNMICSEYKRRNPDVNADEDEVKALADVNLWRQCRRCNHMIELASGCYHIVCRCGYEFCYTCGGEWKNKKATCSCPLWVEANIFY